MIIAQISDTHLAAADAADAVFAARADNLRRCIVDINGLDPGPDVVIHTGDMTHRGQAADFAYARELLAGLRTPLFVTPGNRDGRRGMAAAFAADGYLAAGDGFVHYAVEAFPVRLVALDSLSSDERKGDLCRARLRALEATLAAQPTKPTAIFMHHPPFDVVGSSHPFQLTRRQAADDLAETLGRHPQVIRIFCGHAHRSRSVRIAGAVASTMPSVAVDLNLERAPAAAGAPVYQIHRYAEGTGFVTETRQAA
jgi:3',5'-cyclic AMP phosphodiesterase CpdA